jgi:hypothetical protein
MEVLLCKCEPVLAQAVEMMAHLLLLAEDSSSAVGAAALKELNLGVQAMMAKHNVLQVCAAKGSTRRGRPKGCVLHVQACRPSFLCSIHAQSYLPNLGPPQDSHWDEVLTAAKLSEDQVCTCCCLDHGPPPTTLWLYAPCLPACS